MYDCKQLLQGTTSMDQLVHNRSHLLELTAEISAYASRIIAAQPPPDSQKCAALLQVLHDCAARLRWSSREVSNSTSTAIRAASMANRLGKRGEGVQPFLDDLAQSVQALKAVTSCARSMLELLQATEGADVLAMRLVSLADNYLLQVRDEQRVARWKVSIGEARQQQLQVKKQRTGSSCSIGAQLATVNSAVKDLLKLPFYRRFQDHPNELQQLYMHPLVRQHFEECQLPQYQYSDKPVAAAAPPERPVVRCSQCMMCTPSSCHIIVHSCDKDNPKHFKQLSWEQLQSLAGSAGRSPINEHGSCFLCGRQVAGSAHACSSILWRLLLVDQTALPHANPNFRQEVMDQTYLCKLRKQGHLVAHVVFRCPPAYLPGELCADNAQLKMALNNTWPLLRFPMIIGPSSFVTGQQGAFPLLPLTGWEHERAEAQAGMLRQFYCRSSSSGGHVKLAVPASPTRSMTGCYVGVAKQTQEEDTGGFLAECKIGELYHDPSLVGSMHVLINLAHGVAADLDVYDFSYPTLDIIVRRGSRSSSSTNTSSSSAGKWLPQGPTHKLLKVAAAATMAGTSPEVTWDYEATTDDPQDKLLRKECKCADCDTLALAGKPRRNLVTLYDLP